MGYLKNSDMFESIFLNDILIGTVVYNIEDGYEDLWRIYNIYDDCCQLRHIHTGKKIFESNESLLKKYAKIQMHGVIEFTAVKNKSLPYRDLRIGCYSYSAYNDTYNLDGAGLLLGSPYEYTNDDYYDSDIRNEGGVIEWVEEEGTPDYYYWLDNFDVTKKFKVAIAYYYNDTADSILSFLDDGIFESYISMIEDEYNICADKYGFDRMKYDIYFDHPLNVISSIIHENNIFPMISGIQDIIYVDTASELDISEDGMFASQDVMDDLFYSLGIPSYPCFISEYKLYMDLDSIKNDYTLVGVLVGDWVYSYKVYIVMTYHSTPKLLNNSSNINFNHIL